MNSITIRAYDNNDRDALAALYDEAFPDDPPWNSPLAMIAQKTEHSPQSLLVGVDESGQVVASVMAGYDGHRGWINALCVAKSHRGQGFGEAMIKAAADHLNQAGAVKINLQIRGDNTSLERYYQSLGFESEHRISMGMLTETGKKMQR